MTVSNSSHQYNHCCCWYHHSLSVVLLLLLLLLLLCKAADGPDRPFVCCWRSHRGGGVVAAVLEDPGGAPAGSAGVARGGQPLPGDPAAAAVHVRRPGPPQALRPHLHHADGAAHPHHRQLPRPYTRGAGPDGPPFRQPPCRLPPTRLLFSSGNCTVNSAPYGPLWRTLRRNFVSEIVCPARVKQFGWIRDWAMANHLARLRAEFEATGAVQMISNCRLTICSILACICFGARVPENHVRVIEEVLKEVMMMTTPKLPDFLPVFTPFFRGQLTEARKLRKRQMDCLAPLLRARRAFVESGGKCDPSSPWEMVSPVGEAYLDSLLCLEPTGKGRLRDEELVTLCSEVMSAGTDTSATMLEWAMLHLVLDQSAQDQLYEEIVEKVGRDKGRKITESDVEGMSYLQAVVKETMRRHPPSHFVLSHAATRETELGGYRVPADASVEFYTAWVTENPSTWKDPGEWRPERFMEGGEGWETDITGTRSIRMMPFGSGRRICPALPWGCFTSSSCWRGW
ncbi:unnamed protein product [Musa textilis]